MQAEREACHKSFYEFFLSFWSTIVPEEFRPNWHIRLLCEELQYLAGFLTKREKKPYDLVVNVPPGSTKTTTVLQLYPAWLWTQDASLRILSSSHGHDLSESSANKSKDIILSNKYQTLFPEVQLRPDTKAKSKYATTEGGNRHTTSTKGSATGDHAHIKLLDDLQDITKANNQADREAAIEHMKMLFTREVEKGNSINILIMQRLHEMDCTAYLLGLAKTRKVKHICLPAELSNKVHPPELADHYIDGLLDPVRMSRSVLEEKRIELGSYGYACQFLQESAPPEGGIVKRHWFRLTSKELAIIGKSTVHFFVDTAYEERKKVSRKTGEARNDPTGLLACYEQKGTCYILDYREVYLEIVDLVKFINSWARSNGYGTHSILHVEPKASGKSTVQMLKEFTDLNVMEIKGRKDSKETELSNTAPSVESGRFNLVQGTWNELFLDRVCSFPNAAHDEAVDLLCYARRKYFSGKNEKVVEQAYKKALGLFN